MKKVSLLVLLALLVISVHAQNFGTFVESSKEAYEAAYKAATTIPSSFKEWVQSQLPRGETYQIERMDDVKPKGRGFSLDFAFHTSLKDGFLLKLLIYDGGKITVRYVKAVVRPNVPHFFIYLGDVSKVEITLVTNDHLRFTTKFDQW